MTFEEQKKMMKIEDGVFLIVTSPDNHPFLTGVFEIDVGVVVGDRVVFKDGEWESLLELLDCQVSSCDCLDDTQILDPFCNQIIAVLEPVGGFTYAESRYREQDLKFIRWRQGDTAFINEYCKRREENEF